MSTRLTQTVPHKAPAEGSPTDGWMTLRRVRTHNLANIDVRLPRDRLIVVTGVSGSGKSSLAFDTIYAEGQRRYIESLSSYARQFLEQMPRPDCDRITGLPPTIAIQQQAGPSGAQSTVATTTEIYDFLRLLFARAGTPHCPRCGTEIRHQTIEQIVGAIASLPRTTRVTLLAPLVRGRKGHYRELFESIRSDGYVRARIDGEIRDLDEVHALARYKTHDIDVVVDRLVIKGGPSSRVVDSVRTALSVGKGVCIALEEGGRESLFNQQFACAACGVGIEEPTPNMFSFNSPYGRCQECRGRGRVERFDPELIVPDLDLSLSDGAVEAFRNWEGRTARRLESKLETLAEALGINPRTPLRRIGVRKRRALLHGDALDRLAGLDPQEAVEAPRFATFSFPDSFSPHDYHPGLLKIEGRVRPSTINRLKEKGHRVEWWPERAKRAGSMCCIVVDSDNGVLTGAADLRWESSAMGW